MCRSEPQMPQFFTRRMRSCGPGTGSPMASTDQRLGHFLEERGAHDEILLDSSGVRLCHSARNRESQMIDLYATARDMLADLGAKRVSARELLDAHVARGDALARTINAVTERDLDRARKDAAAIDKARAKGRGVGVLAGLPMTIKDGLDVEGMPRRRARAAFTDAARTATTPTWSRPRAAPARWSGARRMSRTCWATSRATTRSTARRTILTTWPARRADRQAAPRRRSPRASRRWRSGPTSAARSGIRRISAASHRSSRAGACFPCAAISRRRRTPSSSGISMSSGRWRAISAICACCGTCSAGAKRSLRPWTVCASRSGTKSRAGLWQARCEKRSRARPTRCRDAA